MINILYKNSVYKILIKVVNRFVVFVSYLFCIR